MRLEIEPDLTVVGEAEDGLAVQSLADKLRPDVIVMDYEMPGLDGVAATRALADRGQPCRVVMLSIHDSAVVRSAASCAGICAFVAKHEPSDALIAAIREAAE
jgi:DNA-binding NarL/FixJ family response regulator